MSLSNMQQDWNSIAEIDTLWGILTTCRGKYSKQEFFQTGNVEVRSLMESIRSLGISVKLTSALDFGCGIGRLAQAMAEYFDHCYGVDISTKMIDIANRCNEYSEKCTYLVNFSDSLTVFSNNFFDLIYSPLTLQHMTTAYIKRYISEFIRILRPGGILAFQLISYLPVFYRLQPRRRLYSLLKKLGLSEQFLSCKLGLYPIRMSYVPEKKLILFIKQLEGNILNIHKSRLDNGVISNVYFITK